MDVTHNYVQPRVRVCVHGDPRPLALRRPFGGEELFRSGIL
jgi:hypothetical protein